MLQLICIDKYSCIKDYYIQFVIQINTSSILTNTICINKYNYIAIVIRNKLYLYIGAFVEKMGVRVWGGAVWGWGGVGGLNQGQSYTLMWSDEQFFFLKLFTSIYVKYYFRILLIVEHL